jgi:RHS repeat-associated protein
MPLRLYELGRLIRALTLDARQVTTTYDAYSNVTATTGTVSQPLGFAGQYTDADTGFQYLRARYYDPTTGQFINRDPLTPITRLPYAYTAGSPLNYIDPSGMDFWHDSGLSDLGQGVGVIGTTILRMSPTGRLLDIGSQLSGHTIGICVGGSGVGGLLGDDVTGCYVSTPSGEAGFTFTNGGQVALGGPSVNGLVGGTVSNAQNLQDLRGQFNYADVTVGVEEKSVGGSFAWSNNCGHHIWQYTGGWTPGTPSPWPGSIGRGNSTTWATGTQLGALGS